ncbi:MAG: EAL domain-containing protein, partial [Gammaproteobacteria bacterium]
AAYASRLEPVGSYAFDPDHRLLAASYRDPAAGDETPIICPDLVTRAAAGTGPDPPKPFAELCHYRGRPYLVAVVPAAGSPPAGYLQLAVDPVPLFATLGRRLNLHVRVEWLDEGGMPVAADADGKPVAGPVVSEFMLYTRDRQPALRVEAQGQDGALVARMERTNTRLIGVVAVIILITMALALWFVKYSVFIPLRDLSVQLRSSRLGGRTARGEPVAQEATQAPVSFHALGELYETLRDMAIRDPLTGTYNRALFEDRLKQVIVEHHRSPATAAILLIDMVRFKYVNDFFGHHTGDLLLKQVVDRMAGVLRESDTLARLGGDEFTVLLPDTDGPQAFQVAEKIIHAMQDEFEVEDRKLSAAVSIGIALTPDHGEEVETLLRHADYAMYSAKNSQPGCALYDPKTTEEIRAARMTLDGVLNEGTRQADLFLVYQPVVELKTGRLSYLEALVRWRQPDGQILLPGNFIRVAEQSGLIRQLSEWIIDTACTELADLQRDIPGLRVGINLSMHNLHDYNLTTRVREALARFRLRPGSLVLEITETGVMLEPNQVIEILGQLSAMGVELSIDDFGTGHSSLVYLKKLPVHTLKVDRSFVSDMDADDDNDSIVRATIDLAHTLGLNVVAEGVENRVVYERLRGMGCDFGQGYYIGKPLDKPAIAGWLQTGHGLLQSS